MDTMIKTRFTPVLLRGGHKDDVCTGKSVQYDATVAKGNGSSGKAKPAPLSRGRGSGLRACPFCRELFTDDETDTCPECGLTVRDLASLPPSPEAEELTADEVASRKIAPKIPQSEPLPWKHLGRGRGVLMACALIGMLAFYLPWAKLTSPETATWTGAEMAHVKHFYWSIFTAWLVLFPAVASRRTILKMVGARVAVVCLAAIPAFQAGLILVQQKTHIELHGVPYVLHWMPGIFVTLATSVIAIGFAFRFGGRLDDVKVESGSSVGETLH